MMQRGFANFQSPTKRIVSFESSRSMNRGEKIATDDGVHTPDIVFDCCPWRSGLAFDLLQAQQVVSCRHVFFGM